MILLSALLASLTGFVAGERPVERAPVELSAAIAVVESGKAIAQAGLRPDNQPLRSVHQAAAATPLIAQAPVLGIRSLLPLKQSWLN